MLIKYVEKSRNANAPVRYERLFLWMVFVIMGQASFLFFPLTTRQMTTKTIGIIIMITS